MFKDGTRVRVGQMQSEGGVDDHLKGRTGTIHGDQREFGWYRVNLDIPDGESDYAFVYPFEMEVIEEAAAVAS